MGLLLNQLKLKALFDRYQAPINEANQNMADFAEQQAPNVQTENASWFAHPIDKAVLAAKGFAGLNDVLPEVKNAPNEYQDLRQAQLNQNYSNSIPTRIENARGATQDYLKAGGRVLNDSMATKGIQQPGDQAELMKPINAIGDLALGPINESGEQIKSANEYSNKLDNLRTNLEDLNKKISETTDPTEKQKYKQELSDAGKNLLKETENSPKLKDKTNLQLGATGVEIFLNSLLTATTFGTGNALLKGGEKIAGKNFLEKIIESTMGEKILGKGSIELGADATYRQIVAHDLSSVAKNKIFDKVVGAIGNKSTAEMVSVSSGLMMADAVKNGETDPGKIADAGKNGAVFGWLLERGMTGLIKGAGKLVGVDSQRQALRSLITDTETKLGRPLNDAEREIAIQSFKQRVTSSGVADYFAKSDAETTAKTTDKFVPEKPLTTETPTTKTVNPTELSARATNSLENNQTGIKPGALEGAKAEIQAGNTPPVKVRTLEDGTTAIEDGRNHLQAAKELGIKNYPVEDVTSHYLPKNEDLFHGGVDGKLKIDNNGNINLGNSKKDVSQFGKPIKINTDNLNIKTVATKEDMFNIVSSTKEKQKLIAAGIDIVKSDNHAIAINPETFSKKTGLDIIERKQQTVGEAIKTTENLNKEIIGGTKVSKVAKDVNAQAIERHLTENGFDELRGYNPKVIANESEKIAKLMSSDMDKAVKMATGELPTEGVHGQMLFNAVENAFKDDPEVMMKLANSPIATERSLSAQTLGLSKVGNVGGPASKIKEIMDDRTKYVEKKVGDINKATKNIKNEIQAEVKKIPHLKSTWNDFVSQITCK